MWDFLMFYQIFLSPQMIRSVIISNRQGVHKLLQELLNNLRLRTLENKGKSGKSLTRLIENKEKLGEFLNFLKL